MMIKPRVTKKKCVIKWGKCFLCTQEIIKKQTSFFYKKQSRGDDNGHHDISVLGEPVNQLLISSRQTISRKANVIADYDVADSFYLSASSSSHFFLYFPFEQSEILSMNVQYINWNDHFITHCLSKSCHLIWFNCLNRIIHCCPTTCLTPFLSFSG